MHTHLKAVKQVLSDNIEKAIFWIHKPSCSVPLLKSKEPIDEELMYQTETCSGGKWFIIYSQIKEDKQ